MSIMSVVNSAENSVVVDVAEAQCARLIERAVRAKASVVLRPKVETGAGTLAARLAEARHRSLIVLPDTAGDYANLQSAYCDGTLLLEGREYLFSADVLGSHEHPEGVGLEISRPLMLQTWQRRRFVRAAVAGSAGVLIGAPDQFDRHRFEGMVLNVSRDGLACRVDNSAADAHEVGEVVGVSFVLEPRWGPIEMNAAIKSKTPGGTKGTIILRMQFQEADSAGEPQARLAGALESYL